MYVKIYNRILDSSLAENRKLRLFFMDLLLCADRDGMVFKTPEAIARNIKAELSEVEWGLKELQKPDPDSLTLEHQGRRIVPLAGHGYGWQIVNFEAYRDIKSADDLREKARERAKRFRDRRRAVPERKLPGEGTYEKLAAGGASEEELARQVEGTLPGE